jgi:hypothetical protein
MPFKTTGLVIDSTLFWKEHISQRALKMSSAGYAIRALSLIMSQESSDDTPMHNLLCHKE